MVVGAGGGGFEMKVVSHPSGFCVRACVQDRINREVVNVTTLPVPAELAGLLQAASGTRRNTHQQGGSCVAGRPAESTCKHKAHLLMEV